VRTQTCVGAIVSGSSFSSGFGGWSVDESGTKGGAASGLALKRSTLRDGTSTVAPQSQDKDVPAIPSDMGMTLPQLQAIVHSTGALLSGSGLRPRPTSELPLSDPNFNQHTESFAENGDF
jgi:hypothetical protein